MNRRPLSVDLGLLESLDSLSEPMADTARKITAGWVISLDKTNVRGTNFLGRTGMRLRAPAVSCKPPYGQLILPELFSTVVL